MIILILFSAWFGSELFDLSTSAYVSGMGKAFSATNKGAHSVWYNPSGIFTNSIVLTQNKTFGLFNYNFVGFSYTKNKFATSMGMSNLTIDSIPEFGENIPSKPINFFEDKENVIITGFAYKIRNNGRLGINIKYIKHSLYDKQATGVGIDFGANYEYKNFTFATVIKDVGYTKIKWETKKEDKRKMSSICGLNYNSKKFTIATEIGYQGYYDTYLDNLFFSIGAEYSIRNVLFIRGGFNKYLSCGMGIIIKKIAIDYAFQTHSLQNYHIFTVSFTE